MTKKLKKAFDLSRDSIYVTEPIKQLCIEGGKCLPDDEQGDLDTEPDAGHPLKDLRRLKQALTAAFKSNVASRGVDTPIRIVKMDGIAKVVAGRKRVRAARVENRRRLKAGEPLIKIRCVVQREVTALSLIASKISENAARVDTDFPTKLEDLKELLAAGADEEYAAAVFAVTQPTIRGWLAVEDQATDETKAAIKEKKITASVVAELARIKDPAEQNEKLASILAMPEKERTTKAARKARGSKGMGSSQLTSKKGLKGFLRTVQETSHKGAGEKTLAFWEGVEAAVLHILGEEADKRLTEKLAG